MPRHYEAVGRHLGHHLILEKIGAGGMGEVYRARDEHLDREVAIKVLPDDIWANEESRRNFRQDALNLSRLNHAHIATVHDFDGAAASANGGDRNITPPRKVGVTRDSHD